MEDRSISLIFFFITLMFEYLQKLLHCLYIHRRQIHRFYRVHEICDQSDLAILIHVVSKRGTFDASKE